MTMDEIKQANMDAGWQWFEEKMMQVFDSRIESLEPYKTGKGNWRFISSERPPHGMRAFTIRQFSEWDKRIRTVGEFLGYSSKEKAFTAMMQLPEETPSYYQGSNDNGAYKGKYDGAKQS